MRISCMRIGAFKLAVCAAFMVFLVPTNLPAWQKSIRFDRVTTDDGLPEEYVMAMAQDDLGFMWFGTSAGLARYDGQDFAVFLPDPDRPGSIASPVVISLYVDRDGALWAGTDVGLERFDRETGGFTHFRHEPDDETSLGGNVVKEIFEDSKGNLWIGHWFNGLSRFNRETGTFERFRHDPDSPNSLPPGAVFEVFEDSRGDIWVGTYGDAASDAARFDPVSGTFKRFFTCDPETPDCPQPNSPDDRPTNQYATGVYEDRNGGIWIAGAELTRYDPNLQTYRGYLRSVDPSIDSPVGDIVEDHDGNFWIADYGQGLFLFNPENQTLFKYEHDPAVPSSIASNNLNKLFEDKDGRIWISAYDSGVSSFEPRNLVFGHYRHRQDGPSSLLGLGEIEDETVDHSGGLWLVYDKEVRRIDRGRKAVEVYKAAKDLLEGDCAGPFNSIITDRHGVVWLATSHGPCRYEPQQKQFRRFATPGAVHSTGEQDPYDLHVLSMQEDPMGFLWLHTPKEILRLDAVSGDLVSFHTETLAAQGDYYKALVFDENRIVWLGSSTGLLRLDTETGEARLFSHDPASPDSISPGVVTDIVQFHGVWVGNHSGLDRFDPLTEKFSRVTDADGQQLGMVLDLVVDNQENIWISGARGLWSMDPRSGVVKNFGVRDGVASHRMGWGHRLASGELVFGSGNGLNLFDPAKLDLGKPHPRAIFTNLLLSNKSVPVSSLALKTVLPGPVETLTSLDLSWRDYVFAFEFSALEYGNPESIRFSYMLEGFDPDWIETDSRRRSATYTNVPAGSYQFRLRAKRENGEWHEGQQGIRLTILPPWWKTWWAYSAYVLALILLIGLYVRIRTTMLRKRAGELEHAVSARTQKISENETRISGLAADLEHQLERNEALIANISHEFRTPLTLILGPANRMLQREENPERQALLQMVRRNSRRLLRLVDQLLGLSRLKAGDSVPREAQNVNAAVDAICDSFRPVAAERQLQLRARSEPGLWVMCTPDTLDNIVLNLLSNAVKNTPEGGAITVEARAAAQDRVALSVSDTGVGINPEDQQVVFERFHQLGGERERQPGSGIGLALVKELVIEHGGRVALDSQPGKGTTVSLTLPSTSPPIDSTIDGPSGQVQDRLVLEVEAARLSETGIHVFDHARDSGRPLVMVIEDDADMRFYLCELLSTEYDCISAENGKEAIALAFEHVPDLVLCDVMLPGMDGFQVSHELKEDVRTSHVPIILLTARQDRDSRLEGWKEKVDGYLTKPFNDGELLLRISNLLEIREILRSRFTDHFFSETGKNGMQEKDRGFLQKLEHELELRHGDEHFGLEQMAVALFVSPRQLQRKLKAITGQNPAGFLRAFRLRKARTLLRSGMPVGHVADAVGFASAAYFSSCFRAQFTVTPSEFLGQFDTKAH